MKTKTFQHKDSARCFMFSSSNFGDALLVFLLLVNSVYPGLIVHIGARKKCVGSDFISDGRFLMLYKERCLITPTSKKCALRSDLHKAKKKPKLSNWN